MANERRLIDANALKARVKNRLLNGAIISWLFSIIDTCPTVDAVEVVRCKDCKHFVECEFSYCRNRMGLTDLVKPDDFCSYGEKRGGVSDGNC